MKKIMQGSLLGCFSLFLCGSFNNVQARPIKERVESAREVIINRQTALMPVSEWVLEKTKCIGAFRMVKAGFIWGGKGSTGLVSCRTEDNEWSSGSFMQVTGINWGFQIGIQFMESLMLFVSDQARQLLDRPSMQLSSDLGVAAGPVGAGGGSGVMPKAGILTYQRAVGLYAGATLEGTAISHLSRLNEEAYGESMNGKEILAIPGSQSPEVLKPFDQTLNLYFPTR